MMKLLLCLCLVSVAYGQLLGGGGGMPGAPSPANVNDPRWLAMLVDFGAIDHHALDAQNAMPKVEIVGVQTQVVSGMKYMFSLKVNGVPCKIALWEQPWLQHKEIVTDTCTNPSQKRAMLAGGWSVGDPNSDEVQSAIKVALDRVNAMSNSMNRLVENGDVKVQQQVVAGVNYKLDFQVGTSTCMNDQTNLGKSSAGCPLKADNAMAQRVQATVWCRVWMKPACHVTHVDIM